MLNTNTQNALKQDLSQGSPNSQKEKIKHLKGLQLSKQLINQEQKKSQFKNIGLPESPQDQIESSKKYRNKRKQYQFWQKEAIQQSQMFFKHNHDEEFGQNKLMDGQQIISEKLFSNQMNWKQVDLLPHSKHNKVNQKAVICQICLQTIQDQQNQTFLFCFHGFHTNCIRNWLMYDNFCPICKQNVQKHMDQLKKHDGSK